MKKTFSYRILDWFLIGTSLLFSILTSWKLFEGFDFFSSYLLRIIFSVVSVTTFFSLFMFKMNGERFSRIFILVFLIFPGALTVYQFFTGLIFYGVNRLNLLQNPILVFKFLFGIILLYFAIKYSKQLKNTRIKDYGVLVLGIGVFIIFYVLTRVFEPNLISTDLMIGYSAWKTVLKSVIAIFIAILGIRIKNLNIKFRKGIIITSVLIFIIGLI